MQSRKQVMIHPQFRLSRMVEKPLTMAEIMAKAAVISECRITIYPCGEGNILA